MRRPSTAAAAAPNSTIIGGAGTGVPLVELEVDDEPEVEELDEVELLVDELLELEVDDEVDVLLVMFPDVEVLVDTLPDELEVVVLVMPPVDVEVEVEPLFWFWFWL